MPIIEFKCDECDAVSTGLYSMREVTDNLWVVCACGGTAPRILFSTTLEPHFYGNPAGYSKPSPTKRTSTKLVTAAGNGSAVG